MFDTGSLIDSICYVLSQVFRDLRQMILYNGAVWIEGPSLLFGGILLEEVSILELLELARWYSPPTCLA